MLRIFKANLLLLLYTFVFIALVSITNGCKNPPTFVANNKFDPASTLFQPPVPLELDYTLYMPSRELELMWKIEKDSVIFMNGIKVYKSTSDTTFQLIASRNERSFRYSSRSNTIIYSYKDPVPFETPWVTYKIQSFYSGHNVDTLFSDQKFLTAGTKPSDTLVTVTNTQVFISPFIEVPTAEFEWSYSELWNKEVTIQIFKNLSNKQPTMIQEVPIEDKYYTYKLNIEEDSGAIYEYRYSIKDGNDFNSKKETFTKGFYNSNVNVILSESISETEAQITFDWFTPQNSGISDTNPCYYDFLIAELYEGNKNGGIPDTTSSLLLRKEFDEETKSFNVKNLDSSRNYLIRTKVFRGSFKSEFLERTMFFNSEEWIIESI